MPFDLQVDAANAEAGLGDDYFGSQVERLSDGFFADFTNEVFAASVPDVDRIVHLAEQGDGVYKHVVDWMGDENGVRHTAYNLASGAVVGEELMTITGGNAVPGLSGPPDLQGPPYLVEMGRVFGDRNLRGVLSQVGGRIFQGTVVSGASATFLMRVVASGGDPIGIDTLSAVTVAIYKVQDDYASYRELVESHTVDVGESYFASLQEDYQWEAVDPPGSRLRGYNFRHVLPDGSSFPDASQKYLVDFTFFPAEGEAFHGQFRVWART